ncbi:MAG: XamI family restriction endonuclease, partial [Terriglobia bacterium]
MAVNRDKPDRWKDDIARSVDFFNNWFMAFAPKVFREKRAGATRDVEDALRWTNNLAEITPALLREHPGVLQILRMTTCPPLARDRLTGLSGAWKSLVAHMEQRHNVPPKMSLATFDKEARKIILTIRKLIDPDIFGWLGSRDVPQTTEIHRAATIVADRLCGALSDPIIRNAQEQRQLALVARWLEKRGYVRADKGTKFREMEPGTYAIRLNVPVTIENGLRAVNIPIDLAVMPKTGRKGHLPLFVEAKSAGDFTNVNKRRKEEAMKMAQLRRTYWKDVRFILFLCGYFDSG